MSTLKVNEIRHLSNTGTKNIQLETNGTTNLQATSTLGLTVTGTLNVSGLSTFTGNMVVGNAITDTVDLQSKVTGFNNFSGFTGEVRMYAGNEGPNAPPTGWLYCNGDTISQLTGHGGTHYNADGKSNDYELLFNLLKTNSNWGNSGSPTWGANSVKLPDFRSRSPVGVHTGAANALPTGLTARAISVGTSIADGSTLVGKETHALVVAELALHSHVMTNPSVSTGVTVEQDAHTHTSAEHHHAQTIHDHAQTVHDHPQTIHDHPQTIHDHPQTIHVHAFAHTHTLTHTHGTNAGTTGSTTPTATGETTPTTTGDAGSHSHTLTAATSNASSSVFNITNGYTSQTNYGATRTEISTEPDHTHTSAAHTHTSTIHAHTTPATTTDSQSTDETHAQSGTGNTGNSPTENTGNSDAANTGNSDAVDTGNSDAVDTGNSAVANTGLRTPGATGAASTDGDDLTITDPTHQHVSVAADTGSGTPHIILSPIIAINYIIKV